MGKKTLQIQIRGKSLHMVCWAHVVFSRDKDVSKVGSLWKEHEIPKA